MARAIIFGNSARRQLMSGIDRLADVVGVTYGPRGRSVLIQHRTAGLPPIATRDGALVTQYFEQDGLAANIGLALVRQVVNSVVKEVGDGTSTCVVLTRYIASAVIKGMAAGLNPREIRIGMNRAVDMAVANLEQLAKRDCEPAMIAAIAAMAGHGDEEIGRLVADAVAHSGPTGPVAIELGTGFTDEIELVEGIKWEQGYLSPYFITDKDRRVAELDDPYILIYDRVIHEFDEFLPVLELVRQQNRPLLIVAENVSEAALPGVLLNHIRRTLQAVAVRSPGHGDAKFARLDDLAALTGGRSLLECQGDSLAGITLADLGQARKVVITDDSTTITGAKGDPLVIKERLTSLQFQLDGLRNGDLSKGSALGRVHDADELEDRIRSLSARFAVIKIGGRNEIIAKERLQLVSNAHAAVLNALADGVIPGGGVGLLHSAEGLDALDSDSLGERYGIDTIRRALEEPLRKIAETLGLEAPEVLFTARRSENRSWGLDARTGLYGDLYEMGIIDSLRCISSTLQQAASTAGMLMTTECVVATLPPDDPSFGFTDEWAAATREDPRDNLPQKKVKVGTDT
ncbi:MAG: chaperonin GroEL [Acidiphilium sp.]|nr:chaperonin GroEL [Acidiphilium sp.]MDD4935528.1 chaperonin GroEL [Acidiphilium sp.]